MPNFGEDIPEAHDKGEPARGASKESRQNYSLGDKNG